MSSSDKLRFGHLSSRASDLRLAALKARLAGLGPYDAARIVYRDAAGREIVRGQQAFELRRREGVRPARGGGPGAPALPPPPALPAIQRIEGPVYADPILELGAAFEGGAILGVGYFGALHAFAHCGLWFDRVAGTSSGAITAALIAAGYRVDLNYPLDVLTPPAYSLTMAGGVPRHEGLAPSGSNSLNRILFEDSFWRLLDADLVRSEAEWEATAFVAGMPSIARYPGVLVSPAATAAMLAFREWARDLFMEGRWPPLDLNPDNDSATSVGARTLLGLLENGAIYKGDALRDWIDAHLRAKVRGSGPNGSVTFADLPMDLCVCTVFNRQAPKDARPGPAPAFIPAEPVYFSKRTTPDYPVAEAVRRSASLPFVFRPLTLRAGHGVRLRDHRAADGTVVPYSSYDTDRVEDGFFLDGGLRNPLPSNVFFDDQQLYMPHKPAGEDLVAVFMLDGAAPATPRPPDVPRARLPEHVARLGEFATDLFGALPAGPGLFGIGARKVLIEQGLQTLDYGFGSREGLQVRSIYESMPGLIFVPLPVQDPHAHDAPPDARISGLDFGIPKQTRRWLAKAGWEAVRSTYADLRARTGWNIGIGDAVQSYETDLAIRLDTSLAGRAAVEAGAAATDPLYLDDPTLVHRPRGAPGADELVLNVHDPVPDPAAGRWSALGGVWVRTRNADAAALDYPITVDRRVRILALVPQTEGHRTDGLRRAGFEQDPRLLIADVRAGGAPILVMPYLVLWKDVEPGAVTVPRLDAGAARNLTMVVLLR